jgi:hypothetical protein
MPANAWIFALEALANSVSSESGFRFFAVLRNRRARAQNGKTVLTGPSGGAFNKVPLGTVLPAHAPTDSQAITRCGHQVRALATRLPLTRMPCSVGGAFLGDRRYFADHASTWQAQYGGAELLDDTRDQ